MTPEQVDYVISEALLDGLAAMAERLERDGLNPETVSDYCAMRDRLRALDREIARQAAA